MYPRVSDMSTDYRWFPGSIFWVNLLVVLVIGDTKNSHISFHSTARSEVSVECAFGTKVNFASKTYNFRLG